MKKLILTLLPIIIFAATLRKSPNRPIDNRQFPMPGPVVQWIECQIPVLKVVGSTPAGVTKKVAAKCGNLFYLQFCI
jgi:hypothetical protein